MTLKKRSNDSDDELGTRRVKVSSLLFNLRRNYSNSLIHFFSNSLEAASGGGFLRAISKFNISSIKRKIRHFHVIVVQ